MKEIVVMNRWKKLNKDYFNLGKLSLWNSLTTVMKSFRLDCYPFCARRCLSLKKKERKKLGENWMVHSIEAYCSGLLSKHNGFMRSQFNSSSCRCYRISCPVIVFFGVHVCSETKSSSPQKQAHGILMTVTLFYTD